jgi:hypothetical protein
MRHTSLFSAALIVGLCALAPAQAARLTATEENDTFASNNDRHYTQGLRLSYLSDSLAPETAWGKPYRFLSDHFGIFDPDASAVQRRIEWTVLGQSLFTPADIHRTNPDPADRPYAAWLYTGAAFLESQATPRGSELENLEVLVGVVGPAALGRQVQNNFHALIKVRPALGWAYQLHNEPGLLLTYERKWRYAAGRYGGLETDVIPTAGASVGNVMDYAQVGVTFRVGQRLDADYGPAQVRPGVSGTAWFDEDVARSHVGWSLFAGAQGRAVARNMFLDGNAFADSRSVSKKPLVSDFAAGASLWLSNAAKLDLTVVERSPEFHSQRGWDRFGMISVSVWFW